MQVDELLKPFPIKEFHPFPRALLGPGAHELIGPEALKLGFRRTLVMTSGLRGSDIVSKITESMKYHGLEVVLYDKVESNPKDYNVMDSVALYQENECDSFVSIGGGSSHDACKGARVSVAHDGRNVNDFEVQQIGEPEEPAAHRGVHHRGHRVGDLLGLRHHRHHHRPGQPAQVRRLRKAPSISETIDWARTLTVLGVTDLSGSVLADTVSVVVTRTRPRTRPRARGLRRAGRARCARGEGATRAVRRRLLRQPRLRTVRRATHG